MGKSLVLASTSPYRKQVLSQLQLPFSCHSPDVDEDVYKGQGIPPDELSLLLARKKAEALATKFPNSYLIGGDQIPEIDGVTLSKPGTKEAAVKQLQRLQGRTHHLWTAIAVHDAKAGVTLEKVHLHKMTMRKLTEEEITSYVERDLPLDCAGSFKIESLGIALFSHIEGKDHNAIQGLSLIDLVDILNEFGISVL